MLKKRFKEKGYPENLVYNAYSRAKNLSQEDCLKIKSLLADKQEHHQPSDHPWK